MRSFLSKLSPQQNLLFGFGAYALLGALVLCLPWAQKQPVSFLDSLFMSVSALSTTGLATVSTYDSFNWLGQSAIMLLVQIGGIGYMTFSSFVLLSNGQNLAEWRQKVLNAEFPLPQGFSVRDFLRATIAFTVVIELIGAILLFIGFKRAGVETGFALWSSVFHSVSSFCTAGFGLYNDSFEQFKTDWFINGVLSALSILGALGFIVATDVVYKYRRVGHRITFTTKIILGVFAVLTSAGTLFMFFFEPSLQPYAAADRLVISFFQAMSAITTVGFNSVPIGGLTVGVLLLLTFLMYVGASPSGTGGGVKSTTLTAAIALVTSYLRGREKPSFLGKPIPESRVSVAVVSVLFYTGLLLLGVFLLSLAEAQSLEKLLFEAASALGTVGLSTGITGALTATGKLLIIGLMFVGRLGVLTFGLALFAQRTSIAAKAEAEPIPQEDLAV